MKDRVIRSLEWGVLAAVAFFLLSVFSLFLVFGDGTAPSITSLMLTLNQVPAGFFGLERSDKLLLVGSTFWGTCVAVGVFAADIVRSHGATA